MTARGFRLLVAVALLSGTLVVVRAAESERARTAQAEELLVAVHDVGRHGGQLVVTQRAEPRTLNPVMAEGTSVTCAALLSSCSYRENAAINTANSSFKNFAEAADPQSVYTGLISADVGDERLVVVRVTSETQGRGEVKASGCTEGIQVISGQNARVELTLSPP